MSSSGIQAVSSGPLIIRTYNTSGSSDVTYVLQDYDYPVSSNYVLITSTNGQLVPSNNIYISSITISSFQSDFIRASTAYLSSVFGFSPVQFYSPIQINNAGDILMNGGNNTTNGAINGFRNISSMPGGNITFNEPTSQNILIKADTQQWLLKSDNSNNYFAVECQNTGYVNLTTWNSSTSQGVDTIFALGANAANVGIGTNTPTEKLQVVGTISTNNLVTSSILTNATSLNISSAETSTLGNLTVTGTLNSIDIPPVGAINMYAGSSDPAGWLICNGRTVSRTITYNTLFSVIGTTFGSGDGSTTFNIPDMQNRFAVGVGTGYSMGSTGGFVSTTLTIGQIPSHNHVVNDPGHVHRIQYNSTTGSTACLDYATNAASNSYFDSQSASTGITLQSTGNGDPIDNRPPFFGINYIIKY